MSFTCTLFSDKGRCFNQSERALYENFIINTFIIVKRYCIATQEEAQYSPVRLELATLVSSLLYGTRAMLVLNFLAFKNKKYTADDRFHGNGPYGKS